MLRPREARFVPQSCGYATGTDFPEQQQEVPGKRAVITGGDSGIGRAVAIAYAREGADGLISYLNGDDDAAAVAQLVEQEGRKCVLVRGDPADPAHCRAVIDRAASEFGGIDILVSMPPTS